MTPNDHFLKILEEMPLGLTMKLRIGENEFALKEIRKMPNNKDVTMEDIKAHNKECEAWEEGYKTAIEKIKSWRNEKYLEIKGLSDYPTN